MSAHQRNSLCSSADIRWMGRPLLIIVLLLPGCWYSTLAAHELGHALAAALTGTKHIDVVLPVLGFSRTDRVPDHHVAITTAAGFVSGALIPTLLWWGSKRVAIDTSRVLRIWAGFALILNGGYCAADAILQSGDGGQLVRAGMPVWLLVVAGTIVLACGLWLWHRLDCVAPLTRADTMAALSLLLVGVSSFLVW